MPDAILRGLLQAAPNAGATFQNYGAVIPQGNDLVIPDATCANIAAINALTMREQIAIDANHYPEIADAMLRRIPAEFRDPDIPRPNQIHITEGYGRLTRLDTATLRLTAARTIAREREIIIDDLLPCLVGDFGARYVTAVESNVAQEGLISLTKILTLAGRYGVQRSRHLVSQSVMSGVLPHSLEVLGIVDALTRFPPLFLTMPIHYLGVSWHFQTTAMWRFPNVPTNGLSKHISVSLSPLSASPDAQGLFGLVGMNEAEIWRFLRFVTRGVNRLLSFVNDFREFCAGDLSVDLVRKCQAYGAIHLIFADLQGMGSATGAYNRISYATAALDKIANLRAQLNEYWNGQPTIEREAFKGLVTASQRDHLKILVGRRLRQMNYDHLAQVMEGVIDTCYQDVWDAYGNITEAELTARLWSQRNLRHGTYLIRQQFETVFFDSPGTVPDSLATVVFVLLMGLISDPREFLSFRPVIAP
jgi:hypothetical protein